MALDFRRLGRALSRRATAAIEKVTSSLELPQRDPRSEADTAKPFGKPPTGEVEDNPVTIWSEWTILAIKRGVTALVLGNFGPAAMLAEAMLGDDRISAAVVGRAKGTTKCDAVFTPPDEAGAEEVAEVLERLWPEMVPEETLEALITWCTFLGFALAEQVWEARELNGRTYWVPRLKVWHPLWIYFDEARRQYVAIAKSGIIYIEPGDPKWLLITPWGYYRGWLRGAVRSCSIPWVVRQYALRDWGRFSEKHGLPMVVAKVPAQAPAEDKARFYSSIRNLGADTGIQIPTQGGKDAAAFDVTLLEAKDTSWEAFPGLIAACDQSITLAIRGTNLTTEVGGKGSYAAAQTHRDEDSDLAISDRKKLATALRAQLIKPFVLYNFGSAALVPDLAFVSPESDPAAEAKVLLDVSNALVNFKTAGLTIDASALADKFGIPISEDDADEAQIALTPSDSAAIVTVNEAREKKMKLPPMKGPDGLLTIEQLRNKPAEGVNVQPAAPGFGSEPVRKLPPSDALPQERQV
jgi:hypothetical protein